MAWKNMRLGGKFAFSFVIILVLFSAVAAERAEKQFAGIVEEFGKVVDSLREIVESNGGQSEAAEFNKAIDDIIEDEE